MENARLAVGLRRNRQREWPAYKSALSKASGIPENEMRLLQAEESVRFEKELLGKIKEGVRGGVVERTPELSLEEAASLVANCIDHSDVADFVVWLCHGADFAFRLHRNLFANHAFHLLEFDRDTVYAASDDVRCGIGIDLYVSELAHERRYTVDYWS